MRRGVVIALAVMGALIVVLAIVVASVGTGLDEVRIERDDLQTDVGDFRDQVKSLTGERDKLQQKVQEQLKTIEQLKIESERTRSQAQKSAPTAP